MVRVLALLGAFFILIMLLPEDEPAEDEKARSSAKISDKSGDGACLFGTYGHTFRHHRDGLLHYGELGILLRIEPVLQVCPAFGGFRIGAGMELYKVDETA